MNDAEGQQLRSELLELKDQVKKVRSENERLFSLLADPGANSNESSDDPIDGGEEPAAPLTSWTERASEQDWVELIEWVDWLMATYNVHQSHLYSCWPAHPGIAEDLAALKMAWEEASSKSVEEKWHATEAMAFWHDRFLPGFFARLHPIHSAAVCKSKHERTLRPRQTDRSTAVVYATGQFLEEALAQIRHEDAPA